MARAGAGAGAGAGTEPTERVLRLAAFAGDRCAHGDAITLTDIVDGVGYPVDGAPRDDRGELETKTREWETVRKMVTRDLKDLGEAWGIRLDYDDSAHAYRLEPPFFTPDQRRALLAAIETVAVEGATGGHPGELGSGLDDGGALVVLRLHGLVATLRAAIDARQTVAFGLHGISRRVQPYALGMWRNHWYLAGFDVDRGTLRRYRLERIEEGSPTIVLEGDADAYVIPPDFDPESAFDLDPNSWGTDPRVRARVRVGIDHVDGFVSELGGDVVERRGDDVIVELDVRHYASFRTRLLAFRGSAVVLAPDVLVAVVRDHLATVAGGR